VPVNKTNIRENQRGNQLNRKSTDTDNTGHKTWYEDKQNENRTQKTKKKSNMDTNQTMLFLFLQNNYFLKRFSTVVPKS